MQKVVKDGEMHLQLINKNQYSNRFRMQVVEMKTLDEIFVKHGLTQADLYAAKQQFNLANDSEVRALEERYKHKIEQTLKLSIQQYELTVLEKAYLLK